MAVLKSQLHFRPFGAVPWTIKLWDEGKWEVSKTSLLGFFTFKQISLLRILDFCFKNVISLRQTVTFISNVTEVGGIDATSKRS